MISLWTQSTPNNGQKTTNRGSTPTHLSLIFCDSLMKIQILLKIKSASDIRRAFRIRSMFGHKRDDGRAYYDPIK